MSMIDEMNEALEMLREAMSKLTKVVAASNEQAQTVIFSDLHRLASAVAEFRCGIEAWQMFV